jgi:hypothetical protein
MTIPDEKRIASVVRKLLAGRHEENLA